MGTFHRAFLQAHATQNPPFLCYNSFIMTTKEISLCKNFHCLGPACPRNCCRGWHIPVDDATVDRYKSLPGTEGRSVRSFLTRRRGLIVFRRIFGTCPFLNSDRLCQFQANGVEMRVEESLTKYLLGFDYKIATEEDWTAEYDGLTIAIRAVKDLEEALQMKRPYNQQFYDLAVMLS